MKNENTHAGKAESYDLGRPAYPEAFYDFLYGGFGLAPNAAIADIGAGPGKITQGFLARGSRVFAIEPDNDMRRILQGRLDAFPDCTILGNNAEDTGLPANSIDLIFCGNSYYWFDRTKAVPEFRRILKTSDGANIVLTWLRGTPRESEALHRALRHLTRPQGERHNESPPFREGVCETKEFEFTLYQDFAALLGGLLSFSGSPNPGEEGFEKYCEIIKNHFHRYNQDGKLETKFKLTCMPGNVKDLN